MGVLCAFIRHIELYSRTVHHCPQCLKRFPAAGGIQRQPMTMMGIKIKLGDILFLSLNKVGE